MTNNSTQSLADRVAAHMPVVSVVTYSVIFLVGTIGNGLVIYVTGCKMKRTVNTVWFFNLALADFIFTAFLVFYIASASQNSHWMFGHAMCKLGTFVQVVSMFASIFLLMAISLDRCLSIWVVVWAQNKRTVRKAQLIAAGIWLAAVVCSVPYASFRELDRRGAMIYCAYAKGAPRWTLSVFRFAVGFVIPFAVIVASCVAICVRARRLQRTTKRRSHRIIFAIIFAFFICWLPFHIITFIEHAAKDKFDTRNLMYIGGPLSVCLAFSNSCLNPILYVFVCDEFQRKLRKSLCFVLESALAEDHLSHTSSRSLSSHLSRISRKSETGEPAARNGAATYTNTTETIAFIAARERQ